MFQLKYNQIHTGCWIILLLVQKYEINVTKIKNLTTSGVALKWTNSMKFFFK
jgi:hypothetical protein